MASGVETNEESESESESESDPEAFNIECELDLSKLSYFQCYS
jgi:hypothetical protein